MPLVAVGAVVYGKFLKRFRRRFQDALAEATSTAEETFGSAEKAQEWLNRCSRALDGETPIAMADTDRGARAVEALLGRIGHGIAA